LTSPFLTAFEILKTLFASPQLLAALLGGFALAYFMSLYTYERMSAVFSEFWYGRQQALRDALKQARQDAQESTPSPQPIPHGGAVRSTQVPTIQ
jgi:hypothetical protein